MELLNDVIIQCEECDCEECGRDTLSENTGDSRTVTDHWPEWYSASAVTWGMVMTKIHRDRCLVILGWIRRSRNESKY